MRHRVAGRKLSRSTGHRRALYRNLVTDLLRYEKIVTTEAKAKSVCPLAEKMITLGEEKLREMIKTIGLYRNKARNVILLSHKLIEEHGGKLWLEATGPGGTDIRFILPRTAKRE